MAPDGAPQQPSAPTGSPLARRLTLAALVLGTLLALPWLYNRYANVYVYDARVAADVYGLGTTVPGRLAAIHVVSGQRVRQGEVLLQLDTDDAELEVTELGAQLRAAREEYAAFATRQQVDREAAQASLRRARFSLSAATAELEQRRAMLASALSRRNRVAQLYEGQLSTKADLDEAVADHEGAAAAVRAAEEVVEQRRAERSKAELELGYSEADAFALLQQRARIDELQARLGRAEERLENHFLRAPVAGVIDKVFGLEGENSLPGQRLIAMHNPEQVWVSANLRETDLHRVQLGTGVRLRVDAWPGVSLQGKVGRISHAATNQFSLLPSANPSGNFTKVTQRVELRIEVEDRQGLQLLPGTMVEVVIPIEGR